MSGSMQSIEDLFAASSSAGSGQDDKNDESIHAKFLEKEKQIKIKQIERQTSNQAAVYGLPYIDLFGFPIGPDSLSLISEEEARLLSTVVFFYDGKNMRLATTLPEKPEIAQLALQLAEKYHCQIMLYLVSQNSLDYALKIYRTIPKPRETTKSINITEKDLDKYSENFESFRDLQKEIDKTQITDVVTMVMAAAIKSGSSDVHIEAEEKEIKVRFRIDGILHEVAAMNSDLWKKIISRMKIISAVKINVADKPQDGRITIYTKKDRIDIRVSFLPTAYGESVVMRLLRSSSVSLAFEELGIRSRSYEQLKKEVERPNGMIITTGPTGSGKTTTLYAILKKLNDSQTKIITIEDPIEYQLVGVNQSQTSEKYTFAHGLRSIVRQDPDIIMVGEIRDLETAEIAIQAALTGHLVLSTIHTNDAAGTVPRFLSMGTKPFLLSPALNAIIGQRLVRINCQHCKAPENLDQAAMIRVKEILTKLPEEDKKLINFDDFKFYKGTGCPQCQGIGYKGRVGIYEIMTMNAELEKLILSGNVSEYDMRDCGIKNGMVTIVQDGLLKAIDGITSVEEVFRVAE